MALIVTIAVNNEIIATHVAQRVNGGTKPNDVNTYLVNGTLKIAHRYGDGAEVLVGKMMDVIRKKGSK